MLDVKFWKKIFQVCQLFQKIVQIIFFNLIQKQFAGNVPEKKAIF